MKLIRNGDKNKSILENHINNIYKLRSCKEIAGYIEPVIRKSKINSTNKGRMLLKCQEYSVTEDVDDMKQWLTNSMFARMGLSMNFNNLD